MVDFDCGNGLLACMLATLTHQTTSGPSPGPGASAGSSPCVRAVCCHEDISNGCFEILHNNTTSHAGPGLAATTPTESSITIAASVASNDASKSTVVTAASSSSTTTNISISRITLHEYHHQVSNLKASGPGLGSEVALDRCPLELVNEADTMVLRMETFMRTKARDDGSHSHSSNNNNNSTHQHAADKATAAGSDHHHPHSKAKSPEHNDHHSHSISSSSSLSPSSSLKNLQHFCSSLFSTGDDLASTSTTITTITTVLLAVQASTARVFMNESHESADGTNLDKENSKDKTTSTTSKKPAGLRPSVEGAIAVAQALKSTLPATVTN